MAVSFLGFLDALYLTIKHYQGTPPACSLLAGCEKVTTSPYAVIGGLPVALLGAFYYLVIFILTAAYWDTQKKPFLIWAIRLTPFGFLASAGFIYLQFGVIEAVCLYCLISAATSTVLFIIGLLLLKQEFFGKTVPPTRA